MALQFVVSFFSQAEKRPITQFCIDMARSVAHLSDTLPPSKEKKAQITRAREKWFKDLPTECALNDLNTRWDEEDKWVVSQRRFLHKFGYNLWVTFSFMEPSKTAVERPLPFPLCSYLEEVCLQQSVPRGVPDET